MPQLNPSPWFLILIFTWFVLLSFMTPTLLTHMFPSELYPQDTIEPRTKIWSWMWQ